ncbi:HIT domain-containing protein [Patescibacteria group bacterium]|nr:HIT domain-containing protein [Patescibacteria group bacterium]
MKNCLFCKIAKKEAPSCIVYEDEEVIGIKSINPEAPVHLLFIVKEHLEWKDGFSAEDLSLLGQLISVAKKVAQNQKIARAYKLIFNVGKTAHFSHLHLHLLGGWKKTFPHTTYNFSVQSFCILNFSFCI